MFDYTNADTASKSINFPLEVFPSALLEIITHMERAVGYPRDYLASAMLVSLGVAMGNMWTLHVNEEWSERALIYLAIVGNAGANKSHPLNFAIRPLLTTSMETISSAKLEGLATPKPRLVVNDITQEGLVKLHSKNPRGLLLYVDELRAWIESFTRYSAGNQEQFWLSNFSRTPIIVDRKGEAEATAVEEPLISVIGSVQPSVLELFCAGSKSTNGFVDRVLFTVMEGSQKSYWSRDSSEGNGEQMWEYIISQLLDNNSERRVKFSHEAFEVACEWQAHNADIVNMCVDEKRVGAHSKLEIYFVRFCLILHALRCVMETGVDIQVCDTQSVRGAIKLTEYFRAQRSIAHKMLYPSPEDELSKKQSTLLRALPNTFSRARAVEIAQSIGISKSYAYKMLKNLMDFYIDINDDGDYYRLDIDL